MAILKLGRVRIGWRGTWSSTATYVSQDTVIHDGQSYVALQNVPVSTVTTNTAFWQLIAQKGVDGVNGVNGATGPQGTTGATGATGPQGGVGNTGPTTAATWVGTTLSFKTPAGVDGPFTDLKGPQGIQGVQGNVGSVGALGPIGATGATGPTGLQGPTGIQGPIGTTGATGIQGPIGNTGATGLTGTYGAAATVSMGTVATGTAGSLATVTNGGTSSAAMLNFTIPKGDVGATGATGTAGTNGSNGSNGSNGAAGPAGAAGPEGPLLGLGYGGSKWRPSAGTGTPGRSAGTLYSNTHGYPMGLVITCYVPPGGLCWIEIGLIGGSGAYYQCIEVNNTSTSAYKTSTTIIPTNSTYKLFTQNTATTIDSWQELW